MTTPLTRRLGLIAVIDLETEVDPDALLRLDRPPKDMAKPILRIAAASQLIAHEQDDGAWNVEALVTSKDDVDAEESTLTAIDHTLRRLKKHDGTVVTFNGARHDLPILQRRAANHLRFDLAGILGELPRHLDLMTVATQPFRSHWPSLALQAAGLGIPARYVVDPCLTKGGRRIRKCETDAVITFLLLLYELAIRRGEAQPILNGWTALADHIDAMGKRGSHLAPYATHPLVAVARSLIADGVRG